MKREYLNFEALVPSVSEAMMMGVKRTLFRHLQESKIFHLKLSVFWTIALRAIVCNDVL